MARSYYKHTQTLSRSVPYSFQCEHCHQDSGLMTANLQGMQAVYESQSKKLSENQQKKLDEDAQNLLRIQIQADYENAIKKQQFSTYFKDTCPHCQKPQSWSISGMADDLFTTPIAVTIIAILLGLGVYFTQGKNLMMSLAIGGAIAFIALVLFIISLAKVQIKKSKLSTGVQKNLPTIDWSAVDDLIQH